MEKIRDNYIDNDGDLSLKDLILSIQRFYKEVLAKWKWVFLAVALMAGLMLVRVMFFTPKNYKAKLTFMVNEDEGSSFGGIGAILGQFGLGGGKKGKHNLDRLLELTRSRKIVQQVLFEKATIKINDETKNDYLANHIINLYDFHENWVDDTTGLKDFYFTHDSLPIFTRPENKALQVAHKKIIGGENVEGLFKTDSNDDTGIMTLITNTESERLSIAITTLIYEKLSSFYVEKTIEKQKQTYEVVKNKVDSIAGVLKGKEYALANFKDTHRGLWTRKTKLEEQQLMRDVQVLNLMYGEAIKNLEIADFSLKSKTPFVQLIDEPIAPIKADPRSKLKALILGGFAGGFLSVFIIILLKIYRDIMQDVELE